MIGVRLHPLLVEWMKGVALAYGWTLQGLVERAIEFYAASGTPRRKGKPMTLDQLFEMPFVPPVERLFFRPIRPKANKKGS